MNTLDIRALLPHSGRSVLLDRVVAREPDALTAEVTVRQDSLYLEDGTVGAWVGLEYMAQAAAALAGLDSREEGGAVRRACCSARAGMSAIARASRWAARCV